MTSAKNSAQHTLAGANPSGPAVPALAMELGVRFAEAGHTLALVGGSVRDLLIRRPVNDLDFTTDALPDQIENILCGWVEAIWDMGRAYGTIGGRRHGDTVEITTYRAETYDPHSRKPDVAFGTDLIADLRRRDFTVNAMAVSLPSGEFVDPFGGLQDLVSGKLKTPGRPEDSFSDDPLRMLRAARFAAQLGLTPAAAVDTAMRDMADRISIISAERIRDELTKLLLAPAPRAGLELLVTSGLADHVLPELPALRLEVDEHHRHKDVYEHSLIVLEQAIALEDADVPGPDLILRLAALLHDIGKPATRKFEAGGGVSFHHHEVVGAKLVARRLKALRFDSATIKAVTRLVELHLRFHGYGSGEWTDSAVRRYVTDAGPQLARLHRLTRSDCTTRNRRKAERLAKTYDGLEQRIEILAQKEELAAIRPDLDGEQIMAILNLPSGPIVGRAYRHLLSTRMESGPQSEAAATIELLRWWSQQPEAASK